MSYILDALRRADAERQRGDVPGLHAQPQVIAASEPPPARWPAGWLAGGAIGLLALGGGLVWWWMGAARPAQAPVVAMAPAPAQPVAALPAPAPVVPSPATLPPQPGAATLPMPGAAPVAQPMPTLPPMVAPTQPGARAVPPPAPRALPVPPPVAPAPAAVVAPVRPLKLSELPEDLRRELPAIAPGGSVYAEHAPSRMVILNGQVFHEGDRPAPGLQVQQILPRSVVFEFKGQRFELPL